LTHDDQIQPQAKIVVEVDSSQHTEGEQTALALQGGSGLSLCFPG
jgi:hypothetical protein